MLSFLRKRKLLEKLANSPTQQIVGKREKEILNLREPSIDEFDDLIEGMVSEAIAEYGKQIDELDRIIARWQKNGVVATDLRFFKPYLDPFCHFVAQIADRADLKDWIRPNLTPAQLAGCINKILYLLDVEELYGNFHGALMMFNKAVKKAKK